MKALGNSKMKEDDSDKTAFEKLEDEVKTIIFGVLFVMLRDQETSFWLLIICLTISEIQMLQSLFPTGISFPWKAGFIETVFDQIAHFFEIERWMISIGLTLYLVIYYVCIFLVFLIIIDIVYVSYSFSKKRFLFMWPLTILRYVCSLIITFLFMPLLGFINRNVFGNFRMFL